MRLIFIIAFLLVLWPVAAFSQVPCPPMPVGTVCISQQAANAAASNARELAATKEKVAVLEDALKQKDASIQELKDTNAKNVADLKDALNKTEVQLATKTGELVGSEAEKTRLLAIIDVLLKSTRPKKVGLINLF